MLTNLSELFKRRQSDSGDAINQATQIQIAVAALLVEVAIADNNFSLDEKTSLITSLSKKFCLDPQTIESLVDKASDASAQASSVFEFTQKINESYSSPEKFELILAMWRIAFADGSLDKYEDYMIRKIADLIYVPHSEFIRAKSIVKQEISR